jgi:hypothetical protein
MRDVAERSGRTLEAVRKMFKRTFPSRNFSADKLLSEDERTFLVETYKLSGQIEPQKVAVKREPKAVVAEKQQAIEPVQEPEADKKEADITLLDVINFTDMALIVAGCVIMLGWVGLFVSGMAVAFFLDTLRTVKNPNAYDSRTLGLLMSALIIIVSGCLHYVTFRTVLKFTDAELPIESDWVAIILAVIVCCISLAALNQSSNKTTDNL